MIFALNTIIIYPIFSSRLVHQLRIELDVIHAAQDLVTTKLNLEVDVWLGLLVQPVLLTRHLLISRSKLMADYLLLQLRVARAGSLDTQLDIAAAVHET